MGQLNGPVKPNKLPRPMRVVEPPRLGPNMELIRPIGARPACSTTPATLFGSRASLGLVGRSLRPVSVASR